MTLPDSVLSVLTPQENGKFRSLRSPAMRDMLSASRSAGYAISRSAEDAPGWDADDWRRRAACRGGDPEVFFPVSSTGLALTQIVEVKKICGRCPVRAACLRFALATGQEYGIWGGLTEDERRQLRRDRGAGRLPTARGGAPLRPHTALPGVSPPGSRLRQELRPDEMTAHSATPGRAPARRSRVSLTSAPRFARRGVP